MPPEEPKIKRGKILGATNYDNTSGYYNAKSVEKYINTITDPNYPYPLNRYQIQEALDYIRMYEQLDQPIPHNWKLFRQTYRKKNNATIGGMINEILAERQAAEKRKSIQLESVTEATYLARAAMGNHKMIHSATDGAQYYRQPKEIFIEIKARNGFITLADIDSAVHSLGLQGDINWNDARKTADYLMKLDQMNQYSKMIDQLYSPTRPADPTTSESTNPPPDNENWLQKGLDFLFPPLEAAPVSGALMNEYSIHNRFPSSETTGSASPQPGPSSTMNVEEIMAKRDSVTQANGTSATALGEENEKKIGKALGIDPPEMRQSWCTAMSLWAAMKANGVSVEDDPVTFFIHHAKTLIGPGYGKRTGQHEIFGSTAHVNAIDHIARSMSGGTLDWNRGQVGSDYSGLASFLKSTNTNGIVVKVIANTHFVALIRNSGDKLWTVFDTSGFGATDEGSGKFSIANGSTFNPNDYTHSVLAQTYPSPQYFDYFPVKPKQSR